MSIVTVIDWLFLLYFIVSSMTFGCSVLFSSDKTEKHLGQIALNWGASICLHTAWDVVGFLLNPIDGLNINLLLALRVGVSIAAVVISTKIYEAIRQNQDYSAFNGSEETEQKSETEKEKSK